MGLSTVAVGLLPTYQSVGVWAPILLIVVRMVQGFSVGGEFVDSVTYLTEAAPSRRRGVMGSVANLGSTGGMLLAAGVAATVTSLISREVLAAGLWRVPFLLGGVIASAALFAAAASSRDAEGAEASSRPKQEAPLRLAMRRQPGSWWRRCCSRRATGL